MDIIESTLLVVFTLIGTSSALVCVRVALAYLCEFLDTVRIKCDERRQRKRRMEFLITHSTGIGRLINRRHDGLGGSVPW